MILLSLLLVIKFKNIFKYSEFTTTYFFLVNIAFKLLLMYRYLKYLILQANTFNYITACDTSVCTTVMPSCQEHYAAVITNPSECCPAYECSK